MVVSTRLLFDANGVLQTGTVKYPEILIFPDTLLTEPNQDVRYSLRGVVAYLNGDNQPGVCGHYTSFVKHPESDKWYFINDTRYEYIKNLFFA